MNSTCQSIHDKNSCNNKQTSISACNSIHQQKMNVFTKRTQSLENSRPISTNNNNRHIQRCAVSRRISIEKTSKVRAVSPSSPIQSQTPTLNRRMTSTKSKNTIRNHHSVTNISTFARSSERPLRAFQMSTIINKESPSSPKNNRKSSSTLHHRHQLISPKGLTNKTILPTVLPSSNVIANQKRSTNTID